MRTLHIRLWSRSLKRAKRLSLWPSAVFVLVCVAITAGPTRANAIDPLATSQFGRERVTAEIVSQGMQSLTGDFYSQGMMAQNGPSGGEIYTQGMRMSNGAIYSQGMEITIQWGIPDTQPLSQGCTEVGLNCTDHLTDWPASDEPNNQAPISFSPGSNTTVGPGNDPVGLGGSSGFSSDIPVRGGDSHTGDGGASSESTGSGSSPLGSSDLADLFTADNDPSAGPANPGLNGPDDPPSTSASTNVSADPIPEPNSFALFGSSLLLFGFVLRRRVAISTG